MYNKKKILAVITARGDSKRLANKNILDLGGKPLIAWTIDEAKKSKYLDKIIVSTDNQEIVNIAKKYGADVPFMRPAELAEDTSTTLSVIIHAIDFFNQEFDYVLLLQPTSPLRTQEDIDSAIEMLDDQTESVVSVTECEHSPLWTNTLSQDLSMENFIDNDLKNKRSQDLPTYYRINGAIYISCIHYFIDNNGFYGDKTKAYIMPILRSLDIDSQLDFDFVSYLSQL